MGIKYFQNNDELEDSLTTLNAKDFATSAKQDALATLVGEVQASPTANTLLARIKSLEDKIDAIVDGSAPAVTQLSGSIPEYGWLNTDTPPAPADPAKLALGVEINTTTHKMNTKYWNGSAWVEVE